MFLNIFCLKKALHHFQNVFSEKAKQITLSKLYNLFPLIYLLNIKNILYTP